MDWIEVTAKTVADAKELALDRLGVVEDELEFEVVDEPRAGLFRRSDARIRARVKPLSREKPTDRRRRRSSGGNDRSRRSSGGSRQKSGSGSGSASGTTAPAAAGATAGRPDVSGGDGASTSEGGTSSRSRSRGRRGGRSRGGGGGNSDQARSESPRRNEQENPEAEVDVETMPVEEQAAHATEFANELVRVMGFEATVRSDIEEDDVTVRIDGDGLGVLVGPKGQTLHALEEVVRAAVQRHAGGHSARVHVDVSGYRERRRTALAEFARSVAAEVVETGTAKSLEPMSSSDRKVVHDALAEFEGVVTGSEGEDPRRRVVISPE